MTSTDPSPERLLRRKIAQMRRVILMERLWPRIWLPLGVVGSFVLVSLAGLWPLLGRSVHLALLWAFAVVFVASLVPMLRVHAPSRDEALRRLEQRSGVPHRPATALEDYPAGETGPAARSLWRAYRARMASAIEKLKPGKPQPRTDRFDPFAVRALLGLLLIVAVTATWGEMRTRIATAFDLGASASVASLRLDAWIAPPVYTDKPPITLASGPVRTAEGPERREWDVPEGSELTIRVNNAAPEALQLSIEADGKNERLPLSGAGEDGPGNVATLKHKLAWSQTATLRHHGRVVASWPITVTADDAPLIVFSQDPSQTQRKSVRVDYKAEDDYGVASAAAEFHLLDDNGEPRLRDGPWQAPEISLPLPGGSPKSVENQTFKDLTAHPWAGLPVEMVLKARDVAGQAGYSERHRFTLPQREFNKPLARAVIEQRRELVASPRDVRGVVRILDALTMGPAKFFDDKVVYLGLRSAYWRLVHETDIESVKSVVDQLWKIALRIEDGDLSDAEARLRQAQEALREALEEDAAPEEIERLMNELRTALSDFLRELSKKAQREAGQTGDMPPMDPSQMLSAQDLDQMLQDIEDLAKTGSREMAQQMLSQLRNMLENLQAGQPSQSQQAQQMMEMLKRFSEIIQDQQRLLDETYKAQRQGSGQGQPQQGQQGQQGQQFGQGQMNQRGQGQSRQGQGRGGQGGQGQQGQFGQLGSQQRELEEALRQLMEQMGQAGAQMPGQLDGAGEAMGEAGEALGQGDGRRATEQQTLALDRLRQGVQNMAQQILQQLGQQRMGQMGPGMRGRDPLGRPQRNQGADSGESVEVPEEFSVERAREILRELRRRLGNPSRPSIELEYLERLIERF